MMAKDLDVHRSLKFVSLDTHPANNSIVVTYEILIRVKDPDSGQELTRRNRLDKFQIKLSQLDSSSHLETFENDLDEVCENIFAKCPILSKERHRVDEELRLNLRYLTNRARQTQSPALNSAYRPPSSASIRIRSGKHCAPGQRRLSSASLTRPSSSLSLTDRKNSVKLKDKYESYLSKESEQDEDLFLFELNDQFMSLEDQELIEWENVHNAIDVSSLNEQTYLEGLYGDGRERLASLQFIRQLVNDEKKSNKTISHSSYRNLLVCALMRLLRDLTPSASDGVSRSEIESILYCSIRYQQDDLATENKLDLLEICIGNLERELSRLNYCSESGTRSLMKSFHDNLNQIGLLLIAIEQNIISSLSESLERDTSCKNRVSNLLDQLWPVLMKFSFFFGHDQGLFALDLDELDYSSDSKWKVYFVLSKIIFISHFLSTKQEYLSKLRKKDFALYVGQSLTKLLEKIQNMQSDSDVLTNTSLYELELSLIKLITNLTIDQAFLKNLLVEVNKNSSAKEANKVSLLKCTLRNLVCLLASYDRTSLRRYAKSDILLVPFRQLYRLSSYKLIRSEILKSRVIVRCMFDYLHYASQELLLDFSKVSTKSFDSTDQRLARDTTVVNSESDISQILLEANRCEHIILSTWINLISRSSLIIRGESTDLEANIKSYIDSTINILKRYNELFDKIGYDHDFLAVYLHLKLARSMMNSIELLPDSGNEPIMAIDSEWSTVFSSWIAQFSSLVKSLWPKTVLQPSSAILVEILSIISYNLSKQAMINSQEGTETRGEEIELLLESLHSGPLQDFGSLDNEDDDLLIVFTNFMSTLANTREICRVVDHKSVYRMLKLINFVLRSRSNDLEMNSCAVLGLIRLMRHSRFLNEFVNILTGPEDNSERHVAIDLVAFLSELLLMQETGKRLDLAVMANSILCMLMQAEEQLSLSEPFSAMIRFEKYNCKWLSAIRKQNKNNYPLTDVEQQMVATSRDGSPPTTNRLNSASSSQRYQDEQDQDGDDDLAQLRTINPSTIMDFERNSEQGDRAESDSEHFEGNYSDAFDEDDGDISTRGPDSKVIDAESMIGHLISR